jgi:hypothetical protein
MRRINYIKLGVAVMIALMTGFYFCSKNTQPVPLDSDDQQGSLLMKSRWKVSTYLRTNSYRLADYQGFEFVFSNNSMVTASRNGDTYTGSWTSSSDLQKRRKLYISFKDQAPLDGLNNTWYVVELTSGSLRLEYIAPSPVPNDPTRDEPGTDASPERPMVQKLYFEAVTVSTPQIPENNPN